MLKDCDLSDINIDKQLSFRAVKSNSDIHELQMLHKEWFPIDYDKQFYNTIKQGNTICLLADLRVRKNNGI